MYSLSKLKKIITIEAFNLQTNEAIGYFIGKNGIKQRRKFNFRITESGNAEINKPRTIKKQDYEAILNRLGREGSFTFTQIKEMYFTGEDNSPISA
jgi:hypothetical protein